LPRDNPSALRTEAATTRQRLWAWISFFAYRSLVNHCVLKMLTRTAYVRCPSPVSVALNWQGSVPTSGVPRFFSSNLALRLSFWIAAAACMSFTVCVFASRSNANHTMTVLSKLADASHSRPDRMPRCWPVW